MFNTQHKVFQENKIFNKITYKSTWWKEWSAVVNSLKDGTQISNKKVRELSRTFLLENFHVVS